jgi:methylated-DNA-[protein]-cysteine S-methyltransferase
MTLPLALSQATMETPIGPLTLLASDRGLRSVRWDADDAPGANEAPGVGSDVLAAAVEQLGAYFAGHRLHFDLPLDEIGTDFQHGAWAVLRTIPYGQTISYGEQATRLGDAKKARAVGGANGRNPLGIITPCHRVLGADGSLTGFAAGTDRKRWLLDFEMRVVSYRPR